VTFAGITEMRTNARTTGKPLTTAEPSNNADRLRRQKADQRRYANRKAAKEAVAHG